MEKKKGGAIALLPILVFLCFYLGLGIIFEYVMKIEMGFYNIPIVVAFLLAILVVQDIFVVNVKISIYANIVKKILELHIVLNTPSLK